MFSLLYGGCSKVWPVQWKTSIASDTDQFSGTILTTSKRLSTFPKDWTHERNYYFLHYLLIISGINRSTFWCQLTNNTFDGPIEWKYWGCMLINLLVWKTSTNNTVMFATCLMKGISLLLLFDKAKIKYPVTQRRRHTICNNPQWLLDISGHTTKK